MDLCDDILKKIILCLSINNIKSLNQSCKSFNILVNHSLTDIYELHYSSYSKNIYWKNILEIKRYKKIYSGERLFFWLVDNDYDILFKKYMKKSYFTDYEKTKILSDIIVSGNFKYFKILLECEIFKIFKNFVLKYYCTPLYHACCYNRNNMIELLLYYYNDINDASNDQHIPLYVSSQKGNFECVLKLLEMGADPEGSYNGFTPLYVACKNGNYDIAKLLLNYGVNINTNLGDESTPLYVASQNGHCNIVKLLIEKGAIYNILFNGKSPLYISYLNEHIDIFEYLYPRYFQIDLNIYENKYPVYYDFLLEKKKILIDQNIS